MTPQLVLAAMLSAAIAEFTASLKTSACADFRRGWLRRIPTFFPRPLGAEEAEAWTAQALMAVKRDCVLCNRRGECKKPLV